MALPPSIAVTIDRTFLDVLKAIATRLDAIEAGQRAIRKTLRAITDEQATHDLQEEALMSDLTAVVTDLETRVAEMTDVEQSAAALLGELGAKVADLTQKVADAGVDPALVAELQALSGVIADEDGKLSAAVAANTPAASSEPTPEPTEPEPTPEG